MNFDEEEWQCGNLDDREGEILDHRRGTEALHGCMVTHVMHACMYVMYMAFIIYA